VVHCHILACYSLDLIVCKLPHCKVLRLQFTVQKFRPWCYDGNCVFSVSSILLRFELVS
jgi:hypothetical protein